jgi:dihydrofolate reductase
VPYWDDEHNSHNRDLLFGADALVLGRVTYESFAQAWPPRPSDEFVDRINGLPKYVASTTLTDDDATWNASIIQGGVADAVKALKEEPGQSLLKHGTGGLDRTLLANGLLDELHLWVFPVVAGGGQHLLEGLDLTHRHLADSTRFASGIVVNVYTPK